MLKVCIVLFVIFSIWFWCYYKWYNSIDDYEERFDVKKEEESLEIRSSEIQGVGVFTRRNFLKGDRIVIIKDKNRSLTDIAVKINHCPKIKANSMVKKEADNVTFILYAKRDIEEGEEITADYNESPKDLNVKGANPEWKC